MVYLIIPPIAVQVREFALNLPSYIQKISPTIAQYKEYFPALQQGLDKISSSLSQLSTSLIQATLTIFGGLVSFITILVLVFYILVGKEKIGNTLLSLLPLDKKDRVVAIFQKVGQKIGSWVRGQIILCLIIFLITWLILTILGIPYALILALLAGILEIIPTVGPILASIPAILLGFVISPLYALIVALCYFGVQQLENHILVPKIMGKAVGLSPVVVIIALLIGSKLLGIGGAILAVPVAAVLVILLSEWRAIRA